MAKTKVIFTQDHVVIHPATVLNRVLLSGEEEKIAEFPESQDRYVCGQMLEFRSKKDAVAFVRNMAGAAKIFL